MSEEVKFGRSLLSTYYRIVRENPALELKIYKACRYTRMNRMEAMLAALDKWSDGVLAIYENAKLDSMAEEEAKRRQAEEDREKKIKGYTIGWEEFVKGGIIDPEKEPLDEFLKSMLDEPDTKIPEA